MTKKYLVLIVSLILVLLAGVGISYSMWNISLKEEKVNTVMTSCFDITYSSDSNNINLSNAYPISDEKGLSLTPYTFTITNNCDINAYYKINLETLNSSNIDNKFMKVSLNESNPKKINTYESTDKVLNNSKISNNLLTGYLPVGGTENFNLRVWLDYDTTINDIKNDGTDKWAGKIVVVESPISNDEMLKACQEKGGDLIDDSGECRKYYVKLNNNFDIKNGRKNIYKVSTNSTNNYIASIDSQFSSGNSAKMYLLTDANVNHMYYYTINLISIVENFGHNTDKILEFTKYTKRNGNDYWPRLRQIYSIEDIGVYSGTFFCRY